MVMPLLLFGIIIIVIIIIYSLLLFVIIIMPLLFLWLCRGDTHGLAQQQPGEQLVYGF